MKASNSMKHNIRVQADMLAKERHKWIDKNNYFCL